MRSAIFVEAGQPLAIQDVPTPVPAAGQAVIRVSRCGICSSDVHMTSGSAFDVPRGAALGHEYAGEVVEVGPGGRLGVGDRVTAVPMSSCGHCAACIDDTPLHCSQLRPMQGGYSEFALIDERFAMRLPRSLSFADGALVEPLASALHAVRKLPALAGARVAVLGAGPMGAASVFWLRRLGAAAIATVARTRQGEGLMLAMGAKGLLADGSDLGEQLADTLGGVPDIVVEASGFPNLLQRALELIRPKGTILSLGGCIVPDRIAPLVAMWKEVRMQFSAAYGAKDFRFAIDTLDQGAVAPRALIGETIDLASLPARFEELRSNSSRTKVMVDPHA
jgi:(R,R)-butanediol dehydrogenase/meso-butanediol dehydrogenase/diacetyl reductase